VTLTPLLHANPVIQAHVYLAVGAFLLGAYVLFGRKGDRRHKQLGRLWVGAMAAVAVTSFFIWELRLVGLFSPIHLLSIGTLYALYRGVQFARLRQILAHQRTMQITYVGALVIAGFFTFAPGRIMYDVAFGADGANPLEIAVFLLTVAAALGAAVLIGRYRPSMRVQNSVRMRRT